MSLKGEESYDFCQSCVQLLQATISSFLLASEEIKRSVYIYPPESMHVSSGFAQNQTTIPELKQRANDGCRLCSLVLRGFTKEEDSLNDANIRFQSPKMVGSLDKPRVRRAGQPHEPRQFELSWTSTREFWCADEMKTKRVTIRVAEVEERKGSYPMVTIRSPLYVRCPALPNSTFSAASMDQVSKWIQHCEDFHGCYQAQQTNMFLPTRLVEVVKGSDKLRLRDSDQLPPETRYATLSHCWGGMVACQLLKENMSSFKDDIPFSILPRTFQDAVDILKALHIRHIWIDSLCIIQDSSSDWEFEASRMSKVYTNSYISLAATASQNAQEGLFRTREPSYIRSCCYQPHQRNTASRTYVSNSRQAAVRWECVDPSDWVTAIVEAPLNSRAWVYQERALAPRILHFASREIFWECNHMRASETFPDGLPKQYSVPQQKNLLDSYVREKNAQAGVVVEATSLGRFLDKLVIIPRGDESPLDLWTLIVEDYSATQLTYATDKLVAVSALAEIFFRDYKDKFLGPVVRSSGGFISDSEEMIESSDVRHLAGLWSHQLPEQLLWSVKSPMLPTTVGPAPYVAPSWSWASITSPIDYSGIRKPRRLHASLSYLLSANITLSSSPFGAVTAGSIKILAALFKASLAPTDYPRRIKHYPLSNMSVRFGAQVELYALLDDGRGIAHSEVFCLPVFLVPGSIGLRSYVEMEGLLLVSDSPGIYRRVGVFSHLSMHYETLFKAMRQAQSGNDMKDMKITTLKELWWDVEEHVDGDEYKNMDLGIMEVEIV